MCWWARDALDAGFAIGALGAWHEPALVAALPTLGVVALAKLPAVAVDEAVARALVAILRAVARRRARAEARVVAALPWDVEAARGVLGRLKGRMAAALHLTVHHLERGRRQVALGVTPPLSRSRPPRSIAGALEPCHLGGDVGERMPETDEMFTTREGKLRIRDSYLLHRIINFYV